ncbi:MAG: hypothetical protein HQK51_00850 [Oligoflexia bacterium]|nr:hypothetical protein [Oligoflexia bacterium]
MKKFLTIFVTILFCLYIIFDGLIKNSQAEAYLPKDWYVLPENDNSNSKSNIDSIDSIDASNFDINFEKKLTTSREENRLKDLNYSFDRIVSTNEEIFENLNKNLFSTEDSHNTKNLKTLDISESSNKRWALGKIAASFTVGTSGMLGLISGKGNSSLTLWWYPKAKEKANISTKKEEENIDLIDNVPTIAIYENQSDSELKKELAPIIKMVKIKNKKLNNNFDSEEMEKGLIKRAREFRKLAYSLSLVSNNIESEKQFCWYPYKLRNDVNIGASGKVLLAPITVSVGGDVFVRMEWVRLQSMKSQTTTKALLPMDKLQLEMQKMATMISRNLDRISSKMTESNRFDFDGLRMAIGLNASGNIFVAKAFGSIMGHIYFKKALCENQDKRILATIIKTEKNNNTNNNEIIDSDILVEGDASPKSLEIAKTLNIPYIIDSYPSNADTNNSNKSILKRTLYKPSAKRFVAGLEKSVKISRFFSNAIVRREDRLGDKKRWQISKVWSAYALSLTGTVGVATITGPMQMELEFSRKK